MTPSVRPASSSVPHWVQLLAAAVVQQAVCDACDASLPRALRDEARRFLAGNPGYRFWCRVSEQRPVNGRKRANGHAAEFPMIPSTPGYQRLSV